MAVRAYVVTNISTQAISLIYEQGDAAQNLGIVGHQRSGSLVIPAGKKVTIEATRVDLGQLKNLEAKNLLKFSETRY